MRRGAAFLPIVSAAILFGCGDDINQVTRLERFRVDSPFQIKSDRGAIFQIGHSDPIPGPANPDKAIGERLGMQGDQALCVDDSSLSSEQKAKVADIKRRLNNIINRLRNSDIDSLYPGEKNTIKETPNCAAFGEEIAALGELLLPAVPPPSPNTPPSVETSISNIDFGDEGHGWLIMKVSLSNGEKATFHTGVKVKDAESLLSSRQYAVSTSLTKQPSALRFALENSNHDSDTDEYTESCSETRYQRVCHYDPSTKQDVCRDEPYTVYGERSVSVTTYIDTYQYEVGFLTADMSASQGNAELSTTITKRYRSYGTCYINNPWPRPHPGPRPGPHPGPVGPDPFPYPQPR